MRAAQPQAAFEQSFAVIDQNPDSSLSINSAYDFLPVERPVDSLRYRYVKRIFDILFALFMVALFAIPGLLIAAAIRLTSRGPIFYREQRIGRDGRPFRIWKFRSMHCDLSHRSDANGARHNENGMERRMQKRGSDPRVTAVGRLLRLWSVDELPQLFNVLRGEMSMIGPRPIVQAETPLYGDLIDFYVAAIPGISGLWQVSGRSDLDYPERAKLDASYVNEWSLRADFSILFRTVPAVLGRVGAR
jgi:exopolysaccharide production protein ExoY